MPFLFHINGQSYLPDNQGIITIRTYDPIKLDCTKNNPVVLRGQTIAYPAKCLHNTQVEILKKPEYIESVTCAQPITPFIEQHGTCLNQHIKVLIGFEFSNNRRVNQIEICFDDTEKIPIYSGAIMFAEIAGSQTGGANPSFKTHPLYKGLSVSDLYKRNNQMTRSTIININNYFMKGHLSANADFIFKPQRSATFTYLNAAPQWNKLNTGNWKSLEYKVRDT